MVLNTREGHASIRVASVNAPEWGIRVWESMRAMSADSSIIEECAVEALVSTEVSLTLARASPNASLMITTASSRAIGSLTAPSAPMAVCPGPRL